MNRRAFLRVGGGAALGAGALATYGALRTSPLGLRSRLGEARRDGRFAMADYWVWGGAPVVADDGRVHLFASRWSRRLAFDNWVTHSEVVRAVADRPDGPFRFEEVVLGARDAESWDGRMAHNPAVLRIGEGYALFYTGTTYAFAPPEGAPSAEEYEAAWRRKRIGVAVASDPAGPWTRPEAPLLDVRPDAWDATITSNPAPVVEPGGGIRLYYKSTRARGERFEIGVATAAEVAGPFRRAAAGPLTFDLPEGLRAHEHYEDPFVWHDGATYRMLAKSMTGRTTGEIGAGVSFRSEDGFRWRLDGARPGTWRSRLPWAHTCEAYSREVQWASGGVTSLAAMERPKLLLDAVGTPTHLYTAAGAGPRYWTFDATWTQVMPVFS